MYRDKRMFRHMDRKLQGAGMTWNDLAFLVKNPHAMGDRRKLSGSAFEPQSFAGRGDFDDFGPPAGGHISLEDLGLQAGDKLNFTYDYGGDHKFVVVVENVETKKEDTDVIPEVILCHNNPTRCRLVKKGNGEIIPQYRM